MERNEFDIDTQIAKGGQKVVYSAVCKNDPKLGLLISNAHLALDYILGLDISFYEIIQYIFMKPDVIELMANSIRFEEPFFNQYRKTMRNKNYRAALESGILFQLQCFYTNSLDL